MNPADNQLETQWVSSAKGVGLSRRGFMRGMAGILAAGTAPIVGHTGIIMPTRQIIRPPRVNQYLCRPPLIYHEDITVSIEEYTQLYQLYEDHEPTGMQMLMEAQMRQLKERASYEVYADPRGELTRAELRRALRQLTPHRIEPVAIPPLAPSYIALVQGLTP